MEKDPKESIEAVFDTVGDFVDIKIDLLKLQAVSKVSEVVSSAVGSVAVMIFMLFFVILLNIALALVIGEWLGKSYYGFFALAGVYLIAGLILGSLKEKWIKVPVANSIIKKVFK
jgi:hypothetical protein